MSISDFEYTNGFLFQNTYNVMYYSPLYLKIEKVRFVIHQEHFLTLEGVPDSWDGDGEPHVDPM